MLSVRFSKLPYLSGLFAAARVICDIVATSLSLLLHDSEVAERRRQSTNSTKVKSAFSCRLSMRGVSFTIHIYNIPGCKVQTHVTNRWVKISDR